MVALDLLVVASALASIRLALGGSVATLQWTVTGYGLSFAALLMAGAAVGDRFGRRRVFVVGLALFAAASASCALAPNLGRLIASRVVQGSGAALVMPLAMALLTSAVPAERRGRALGVFEGTTGLATVAGPPIGGGRPVPRLELDLLDQRPDQRGHHPAGPAARAGEQEGWTSPEVLVTLSGRGPRATRLPAVADPGGGADAAASVLPGQGVQRGDRVQRLHVRRAVGSVFFLAQFLQTGQGLSPIEAGLRLVPWTATLLVVAPLAGEVGEHSGSRLLPPSSP